MVALPVTVLLLTPKNHVCIPVPMVNNQKRPVNGAGIKYYNVECVATMLNNGGSNKLFTSMHV